MDFIISQTKPSDLVQVIPLAAVTWHEVEKVVFPPQPRVTAHMPLDMRTSRWELYQCIREVPVMAGGRVVRTMIFPWHLHIEEARIRMEESAPENMHWMLSAVTSDDWIAHQLLLPQSVRQDLEDLERRRAWERGGMRAQPKLPLKLHVKHDDSMQEWRVDHDMTVEYFLQALALEMDTRVMNLLLMRGTHIPRHRRMHSVIPPDCTALCD